MQCYEESIFWLREERGLTLSQQLMKYPIHLSASKFTLIDGEGDVMMIVMPPLPLPQGVRVLIDWLLFSIFYYSYWRIILLVWHQQIYNASSTKTILIN